MYIIHPKRTSLDEEKKKKKRIMPPRPVVVFCGPSGVGKSTLLRKLIVRIRKLFRLFCISHYSRTA
ncbi:hypothetical protein Avbf_07766 [Armadillidium vulgare]|nr:hypothetical protein Avbf_07766 [Armadillidium vulgare]